MNKFQMKNLRIKTGRPNDDLIDKDCQIGN